MARSKEGHHEKNSVHKDNFEGRTQFQPIIGSRPEVKETKLMSELKKCMRALEQLGMGYVKKSIGGRPISGEVARAIAITKASEMHPELTRHILNLERQAAMRKSYAWLTKGSDDADAPDEGDLVEELKKLRRREAAILQQIRLGRRGSEPEEDEWSSQFGEA